MTWSHGANGDSHGTTVQNRANFVSSTALHLTVEWGHSSPSKRTNKCGQAGSVCEGQEKRVTWPDQLYRKGVLLWLLGLGEAWPMTMSGPSSDAGTSRAPCDCSSEQRHRVSSMRASSSLGRCHQPGLSLSYNFPHQRGFESVTNWEMETCDVLAPISLPCCDRSVAAAPVGRPTKRCEVAEQSSTSMGKAFLFCLVSMLSCPS